MISLFSRKSKSKNDRKARKVVRSSGIRTDSYVKPSTSKRRDNKPKKTRKKTHMRKVLTRLIIAGIVMIVIGVVVWSNLRINHVIMSSPQGKYIEVIEKYLERNPVANLKPLVSTNAIADDLLRIFPEVASVTLEVPFLGERIVAQIVIREDQLVLKTGDNNYYIVDQDGYAYAKYDKSRGFEGVLILEDDTGVEYGSEATGQFVAPSLVEFIQGINKGLIANQAYEGQSFAYKLTDEARVIYAKPSKSRYEIKFQQDISVEQQIDNLDNVLAYLEKNSITPIRYIDVRLNGTTYYK